jgi:hypothetical protein
MSRNLWLQDATAAALAATAIAGTFKMPTSHYNMNSASKQEFIEKFCWWKLGLS